MARKPRTTPPASPARLVVRNATMRDVPAIRRLVNKVYEGVFPYSAAMLRGQIAAYAEGCFVALYDDTVVGYSASFRIDGDIALKPHTWQAITGGGFASRHDPNGEWLYGLEISVDPDFRGTRIGQRLYNARKQLCLAERLHGIVFGGRLPGLSRRQARGKSPEEYMELVQQKKLRDNVLSFQLRNGFEPLGVLPGYFPEDKASRGFASLMVWRNPEIAVDPDTGRAAKRGRLAGTVRVGAVQYQQRRIASFEEFGRQVEYFVDVVSDYGGDFVVFPELFTLQLLSIDNLPVPPAEAIASLDRYREPFVELMSGMAVRYNVNIVGGSLPTKGEDGLVRNVCYVFLRDGAVHQQAKIHPTPNERYWWNITGGDRVDAIMTDCGPIGVLICYDSEFPELPRHLVDQGAQILFVPFCTDERQSYMRVRYCCQARAIENQCYVVLSGNVGNLPAVHNMDIQYSQSCILTPCDFSFARDGIAADTTPNVEMVAFADLRLADLYAARNSGTVQNLKDRRFDLYGVVWRGASD